MANYLTTDTDITAVANAIRTRGGTSGQLEFPNGFVSAIQNIPSGSDSNPTAEDNNVIFVDYDGTIRYSYTTEEFLALTELPANPVQRGLIAQGWNWTLADIKSYMTKYPDAVMIVGQMYIPSDGKTHMILDVGSRLIVPIVIQQTVSEGVTINWGDDSDEETIEGTGAVTTSHTYVSEGEYEVTLEVADGCRLSFGGMIDNKNYNIFKKILGTYTALLKKVFVGNGILSIGQYAFSGCVSLSSITIPNSVTSLGQSAFSGCYSLSSITIPNNVTAIGQSAFSSCFSLSNITIPNSVTSLEQSAFSSCNSLSSITIPNSITTISYQVFGSCDSLSSITIPDSVTTIYGNAFSFCNSLSNIIIPNSVKNIESSAFSSCVSLSSITMPGVIYIGQYAFSGCNSLSSITIPNHVTDIKLDTFQSCHSLSSITIPDSVTAIGQHAFSYCYSLSSITIPDSVIKIEQYAFSYCSNLYTITILRETPPTLGTNVFYSLPADCTIYVPHGKGDTYKSADGWSTWASQIQELPE